MELSSITRIWLIACPKKVFLKCASILLLFYEEKLVLYSGTLNVIIVKKQINFV